MGVRLIRSLRRLEDAAAAANAPEPVPQAICLAWKGRAEVDAGTLLDGQYIAVDVVISIWGDASAPVEGKQDVFFRQVAEHERITSDPEDLGWVTNGDGRRIGRVIVIDGDLVTTDLDADWRAHVPTELPPILCGLDEPGEQAAGAGAGLAPSD